MLVKKTSVNHIQKSAWLDTIWNSATRWKGAYGFVKGPIIQPHAKYQHGRAQYERALLDENEH